MKKYKSFFSMARYETIRVMRNKVVMFTLLGFALVVLLTMALLSTDTQDINACMYTNGENVDELHVIRFLESKIDIDEVLEVGSMEEGQQMVKENKCQVFIYFDTTTTPTTAVVYYSSLNGSSLRIRDSLWGNGYRWAYKNIYKFLKNEGYVLNENYFNGITYEPVNDDSVNAVQRIFGVMSATCIGIIIMFGLAFSVSRDKETNVSTNLNYLPIGANRFLLSKIIPYLLLSVIEILVILLLGRFAFKIRFVGNVFAVFGVSLAFIFAIIMLGLLFSLLKNQISASLFSMMTMLIPIFVHVLGLNTLPRFAQIVFNILPITSFVPLFDGLIFNGVILWKYLIALILQVISYYFISLMILKKQIKR